MMKVVVAFDSFKGCLTAAEACGAAVVALKERFPQAEVVQLPLSDGGEGLVSCVGQMLPLRLVTVQAHDPLMRPIEAQYALSADGQTAYFEMAATCGLTLVAPAHRDVMRATTYGVGEMVLDAIRRGVSHIVMGIGGSATSDGGRGMIACLRQAGYLQSAQAMPQVTVACDVANQLYGPQGAAYVFAPQKGALPEQVVELDRQLQQWARETEAAGWADPSLAVHPGTGAAGGLGYALMAYLHATLLSGIDVMLDIAGFDALVRDADLVITGEGKSDQQTLMGKVPHGVLRRCRAASSCRVWLLSGAIDDPDGALASNFDLAVSINADDRRPLTVLMQPEVAMANIQRTMCANAHLL